MKKKGKRRRKRRPQSKPKRRPERGVAFAPAAPDVQLPEPHSMAGLFRPGQRVKLHPAARPILDALGLDPNTELVIERIISAQENILADAEVAIVKGPFGGTAIETDMLLPAGEPNPLVPGPPPRYVMGGMGTPLVWEYQGRTITTRAGKAQDWAAEWIEPEEENELTSAWGRDEQEALANARYKIDLYAKGSQYDDYYLAEGLVQHVMDWMHDATKDKPTRANVARRIKEISAEVKKTTRGEQRKVPAVAKYNVEAFDKLPLPERVKLIDEVIDYQIRANMWEPQRLPNPVRKRMELEDRKRVLLSRNPPTTDVLPVIKRGHYPQMILGTVGRKGVYLYRGWELEILKNIPDVWDVNVLGPAKGVVSRSDEFLSSRTYDGALCVGKITVDIKEAAAELHGAERGYLLTTWADIGTIAHNEAAAGRLPTRAAVARAIAEGRRQAGARGQTARWQWVDALPLGDRVQLIDDRLELSVCMYGTDLHFWP